MAQTEKGLMFQSQDFILSLPPSVFQVCFVTLRLMVLGHAGPGAVLEKWCPAPVRRLSSGSDTTPPVSAKHLTLNHSFMLVPSGQLHLLLFATAQADSLYICFIEDLVTRLIYSCISCQVDVEGSSNNGRSFGIHLRL